MLIYGYQRTTVYTAHEAYINTLHAHITGCITRLGSVFVIQVFVFLSEKVNLEGELAMLSLKQVQSCLHIYITSADR